jgi:predicted nucleic acid-binding protein
MNDVVVDASVWVSRFDAGDVHHARCQAWFEAQSATGAWLIAPVLALAEVSGAIARRTGLPKLAHASIDLLQRLPNVRLVALDSNLAREAARLAADQSLRGADAVYVATAARLGVALATLDHEQAERAQTVISTVSL